MKSNLVDIACEIRQDDPTKKAIAVADGTMEEVVDQRTGEVTEREKWFWLPRSQIEIDGEGTVTLPDWLAREKGLI